MSLFHDSLGPRAGERAHAARKRASATRKRAPAVVKPKSTKVCAPAPVRPLSRSLSRPQSTEIAPSRLTSLGHFGKVVNRGLQPHLL